ncbi:MAG: 16S rRNA (cytosine(1402)-N(4))-methyltransferase RsmH [Candidatus Gastranaerophilaceae bacterium]|jgi:16S rRNA (cytosine1402-N4)-methyltransferase|nr:16S rRNA (cytosine(1402)-N(4))-methyltransferase RsmH [bacterium]CDE91422.1 ribosomal RNA small subunit methyltransferase H [Fusobacterium sp. CAG:815]DAA91484.1 MAG TPA: 16S rRNA (cytosine(1402)-N(4))-methyltransferase RsmH [Candidatus Gastranaerophilales bacterium HUM_7]DAA92980.1 MAG TPA: 16S rRNA (cytosine(1402)-N(4))-methyltransferase RsmH [Candidatus Gastranaerophilales bacterium HUM_6]DAB04932.1 MAG TPA: 16S rRNA (cytosine(1402)-N(4))-methyltransferase RsmH [Candidatus Gastranaerophil
MKDFTHYTVMKNEAVDALNCKDGLIYVDCTLGGGGHSELILQRISPNGKLISFDIDQDAIDAASERLKAYKNLTIVKDSYTNVKQVLKNLGIEKITGGILFDLGASYHQLTKQERGFSFSKEAPLDMRFNMDSNFSAYDVVNDYSEDELVKIFSEYGEERFSKRIAKKIVEQRKIKKLETTTELADLIVNCTPKVKSHIHPATRVFQAIRIEVNHELQNVKNTLNDVLDLLDFGAIISVISFHSLEDRLVKQTFKYYSTRCHCERNQMVCNCPPPVIELVNKKPMMASEEEIKENPPSRSAKLRIARCIRK